MIVVDTKNHITFDSHSNLPELACQGLCKKVWWHSDMTNRPEGICQLCGGLLIPAVEKKHYTVLDMANRPLKASDFGKYAKVPHSEKLSIKRFMQNGRQIDNLSVVKPGSEQLARDTWCQPDYPNLHCQSDGIH